MENKDTTKIQSLKTSRGRPKRGDIISIKEKLGVGLVSNNTNLPSQEPADTLKIQEEIIEFVLKEFPCTCSSCKKCAIKKAISLAFEARQKSKEEKENDEALRYFETGFQEGKSQAKAEYEAQVPAIVDVAKQERNDEVEKIIDELKLGFETNLDAKMSFESIDLKFKPFLILIVEQFGEQIKTRIKGVKE